jgi:hypothetical protein
LVSDYHVFTGTCWLVPRKQKTPFQIVVYPLLFCGYQLYVNQGNDAVFQGETIGGLGKIEKGCLTLFINYLNKTL